MYCIVSALPLMLERVGVRRIKSTIYPIFSATAPA